MAPDLFLECIQLSCKENRNQQISKSYYHNDHSKIMWSLHCRCGGHYGGNILSELSDISTLSGNILVGALKGAWYSYRSVTALLIN